MLDYLQKSTEENVKGETLHRIHRYIEKVKVQPEMRKEYMLLEEKLYYERKEAAKEADMKRRRADTGQKNTRKEQKRMDITLHYTEEGTGTPLILLHGNGEDGTYFKHQLAYFSKKYRVIAVDTRGHGQSPRGAAPFTISQFAEDLNEFLEQKDISKAVILGFSDGANIAMRFAMKHPEKVEALILNGGNLNAKGVKASVQIPIELGYRITKLFSGISDNARKNHEMLALMVDDPNIEPSELRAIHVPTLVIAGTEDMIKEEHTKLLAAEIPGAELKFVKGDHFIASKAHEEFNAAVDSFLERVI